MMPESFLSKPSTVIVITTVFFAILIVSYKYYYLVLYTFHFCRLIMLL